MRRNCDSPHCPRTLEALSEPASDEVSRRSSSVVAVTRRDLTFDTAQCVTQGPQQRCGLRVVAHRRLEVDDAFTQHVAFGLRCGELRDVVRRGHGRASQGDPHGEGSEGEAGDERHEDGCCLHG